MQGYLLAAAIVAAGVGIVHSVLGEWLIFRKLRASGLVPTRPAPPLQARNIGILWATWHLASVFGLAFAGILLAFASDPVKREPPVLLALMLALAVGAILVFAATRGRHPGWIGLLAAAILIHLGS